MGKKSYLVEYALLGIINEDSTVNISNTPMQLNEDNVAFIVKRIKEIHKSKVIKVAKFKQGSSIKKLIDDNRNNIKELSTKLAAYIADKYITHALDGDILVVVYEYKNIKNVAVILLGHTTNLSHKIQNDKKSLDLAADNKTPSKTTNGIIVPLSVDENSDIELSDFINMYCGRKEENIKVCEGIYEILVITTKKDSTEQFLDYAEEFITEFSISAVEATRARKSIIEYMESNTAVDMYKLSELIYKTDEKKRKRFVSFMVNERGLKDNFEFDKKLYNKKYRNIRLSMPETKSMVKIPYEAFNDINSFQIIENSDNTIDIIIKNIDTFKMK